MLPSERWIWISRRGFGDEEKDFISPVVMVAVSYSLQQRNFKNIIDFKFKYKGIFLFY
jgi:hypothetical protein